MSERTRDFLVLKGGVGRSVVELKVGLPSKEIADTAQHNVRLAASLSLSNTQGLAFQVCQVAVEKDCKRKMCSRNVSGNGAGKAR